VTATFFSQQALTGLQFVSAAQGWAVGQDTILATTDGGAHWTAQLAGRLNLTSVDFINAEDGWAAGTTSLLATTDGGRHWTPLAEPCPLIRSVHFIAPRIGFAVAGGRNLTGLDPSVPATGGILLTTGDGGHTWQQMPAPADVQTACFSDVGHGWLGADGLLYRTSDGGRDWTALTKAAPQVQAAYPASMLVECANAGAAWAVRVGPGAGMSQQPHVGYHADQSGVTAIFAEQYYHVAGDPEVNAPGSYAGPFSAIDAANAAFVDSCSPCGAGTAPWAVASGSGSVLTKEGNVGDITQPEAASFLSPETGWVAGEASSYPSKGTVREQQRIVATTDGGRTWHLEWSGPWTS
jgi:Photosynthesis system II assembly factor YCF48